MGGAASSSPPAALFVFPGPSGNCGGACAIFDSASVIFKTTLVLRSLQEIVEGSLLNPKLAPL